jgi:prepilin-type N-terminal cleavage/methylation domain-containing protein
VRAQRRPAAALNRRQGGFTLLEILVGFVIIAMVTTVALRSSSFSIDASGKTGDATRAALQARALLSEFGVSRPLEEGEFTERLDDTTAWTLQVSKLPSSTPLLDAHALTLAVTTGRARVVLRTHRITPTQRAP